MRQVPPPMSLKNLGVIRTGHAMNRENWVLTDIDLAVKEVLHFKSWGGKSIVDVTSIGLGRDPRALMQAANATGLNIGSGV